MPYGDCTYRAWKTALPPSHRPWPAGRAWRTRPTMPHGDLAVLTKSQRAADRPLIALAQGIGAARRA